MEFKKMFAVLIMSLYSFTVFYSTGLTTVRSLVSYTCSYGRPGETLQRGSFQSVKHVIYDVGFEQAGGAVISFHGNENNCSFYNGGSFFNSRLYKNYTRSSGNYLSVTCSSNYRTINGISNVLTFDKEGFTTVSSTIETSQYNDCIASCKVLLKSEICDPPNSFYSDAFFIFSIFFSVTLIAVVISGMDIKQLRFREKAGPFFQAVLNDPWGYTDFCNELTNSPTRINLGDKYYTMCSHTNLKGSFRDLIIVKDNFFTFKEGGFTHYTKEGSKFYESTGEQMSSLNYYLQTLESDFSKVCVNRERNHHLKISEILERVSSGEFIFENVAKESFLFLGDKDLVTEVARKTSYFCDKIKRVLIDHNVKFFCKTNGNDLALLRVLNGSASLSMCPNLLSITAWRKYTSDVRVILLRMGSKKILKGAAFLNPSEACNGLDLESHSETRRGKKEGKEKKEREKEKEKEEKEESGNREEKERENENESWRGMKEEESDAEGQDRREREEEVGERVEISLRNFFQSRCKSVKKSCLGDRFEEFNRLNFEPVDNVEADNLFRSELIRFKEFHKKLLETLDIKNFLKKEEEACTEELKNPLGLTLEEIISKIKEKTDEAEGVFVPNVKKEKLPYKFLENYEKRKELRKEVKSLESYKKKFFSSEKPKVKEKLQTGVFMLSMVPAIEAAETKLEEEKCFSISKINMIKYSTPGFDKKAIINLTNPSCVIRSCLLGSKNSAVVEKVEGGDLKEFFVRFEGKAGKVKGLKNRKRRTKKEGKEPFFSDKIGVDVAAPLKFIKEKLEKFSSGRNRSKMEIPDWKMCKVFCKILNPVLCPEISKNIEKGTEIEICSRSVLDEIIKCTITGGVSKRIMVYRAVGDYNKEYCT